MHAEHLEAIRKEADSVLWHDFALSPPTGTITLYNAQEWVAFLDASGGRDEKRWNVIGQYYRNRNEAHVLLNNQWISTVFHELHGHGTYYTRSCIPLSVDGAYAENDIVPGPWGVRGSSWRNSEAFATWMEAYLCSRTGRTRLRAQVVAGMPREYRAAFEAAQELEKQLSPTGFLRQMGVSIPIDATRAQEIVRATTRSRRVDLAVHIPGTQHPDRMQVLLVSDARPSPPDRPWLASRVIDTERFIADTLRRDETLAQECERGELLFGDTYAWERAKERLVRRRV